LQHDLHNVFELQLIMTLVVCNGKIVMSCMTSRMQTFAEVQKYLHLCRSLCAYFMFLAFVALVLFCRY